jgi:hypothetical protein
MGLVEDAPHHDVTYKVIGRAMAVHNDLGPGHRELVYHRALAAEFQDVDTVFTEEPCISVEMEDGTVVGLYYPDFIVEDVVIALLINFGQPRLEWHRLFPPKKISEHRRKKWGKPLE